MQTKIYIGENYDLLDLFNDETINVTSKLSDIEKLSSVFSDYSNSFTIPATPNNNRIFRHYYDYTIDNAYNANIRINSYIEVDTLPFKFGAIQLEGVTLKDFQPESYKITFFGGVTQLSDLFGEDTINRLDYSADTFGNETKVFNSLSQFDYDYTGPTFLDTINNPSFKDGNIITPLIGYADRDWNYGTNDIYDIATSGGAILDSELRPAIRVINIINAIETKYGITFTRNFFGKAVFNNLFLWMNASIDFNYGKEEIIPTISNAYSGTNDGSIVTTGNEIAITHRKYTTPRAEPGSPSPGRYIAIWNWIITPTNAAIKYDAHIVYAGGSATDTPAGTKVKSYYGQSGTKAFNMTLEAAYGLFPDPDGSGINESLRTDSFYLVLVPSETLSFDMEVEAKYLRLQYDGTQTIYANIVSDPNTQTLQVAVQMEKNLPNLKVLDFIQGIMKMFKLVIRPLSNTSFYIDTLNGYYGSGNQLNISEYIDNKSVDIDRPLIYRTIKFLYQKTDNVTGKNFRITNDPHRDEVGYGDLRTIYPTIENRDELKVELPFENMLFERLVVQEPSVSANTLTNIIIGQSSSLNEDGTLSKNNSKPIFFFNNGISINPDFPIQTRFGGTIDPDGGASYGIGGTVASVAYPYIIGNTNDEIILQVTDSINWGSEIDPWHLTEVSNSLYLNYWEDWINTIYSLKQRKFTYSAVLPSRFIRELSLNDKLIIGNNRFKINDYTINLNTRECKFTLFNDIFEYVETPPVVGTTHITANAGTKYYGVNVNTDSSWSVVLEDDGYGTDWVEVTTPSGVGSSEVVFRVLEKASQTPPEVYEPRTMIINILINGEYYPITLIQYGL
jgi:hypothetical protein